jgi:integrase
VAYCRTVLRDALNQGVRDGILTRNVAGLTDPPRSVQHEIAPFSPEQVRALLKAVDGHRLQALFTVAIALGMRQGEMLGLRWEDVDLHSGLLRVRNQL